MSDLTKEQQDNKAQEGDKVTKGFEATMKKLVAIAGGDKNLFPKKKVSKDSVKTIVDGLLSERKEATEKEVKEDIIKLLDGYVAYTKAVSEKEKEFIKLKQDKMKEFSESAAKVFNKIDSIDKLSDEYYAGIAAATGTNG